MAEFLLNDLSHKLISSCFSYDELEGDLYWLNGKCKGQIVGSIFEAQHGKLYWRTKLCGRNIFNHRIIWFMKTMFCPKIIDHWDGNGLNNVWDNLRDATQAENFANGERLIRGVDPFPNGKWRAKITVDRQQIHLGMYDTKEQALEVYRKTLIEVHGDFAVYNRRQQFRNL